MQGEIQIKRYMQYVEAVEKKHDNRVFAQELCGDDFAEFMKDQADVFGDDIFDAVLENVVTEFCSQSLSESLGKYVNIDWNYINEDYIVFASLNIYFRKEINKNLWRYEGADKILFQSFAPFIETTT